jgi:hypothetical protein
MTAFRSLPLLPVVAILVITSYPFNARSQAFTEPQTETEAKILQKLLERRTFTPAEIDAIDQAPKDGIINVRDLVLHFKAKPKPPYAFFPAESSRLVSGVQESANLTVYFTKPFTGTLWYQLSGDGIRDSDFQLANGEMAQGGAYVGSITVSNANSALIPVQMAPKTKLTGVKSLVVTLLSFRDVASATERTSITFGQVGESTLRYLGYRVRQADNNTVWRTTAINGSTRLATWAQDAGNGCDAGPASAHRVDLHEADRGLFRGVLKFYNGSGLDQQNLLIAVRSSGQAFFDSTEAKLFTGPFAVPVAFGPGGTVIFNAGSQATGGFSAPIGGRTVTWILRLREQIEVATATEAARLALNLQAAGLSVGDRVRQTGDATLWTLLDNRFPDSTASWRPQQASRRVVTACMDLTNLAAQPYTACGVLELSLIEAPIAP